MGKREDAQARLLAGGNVGGATDINDRGQVVGDIYVPIDKQGHSTLHVFLWQNGKLRDLGKGEDPAINERDQIVGSTYRSGVYHAWLWQNGKTRELASGAKAVDINDRGQILMVESHKEERFFLYENGRTRDVGYGVLLNNHGVVDADAAWQTGQARQLCVQEGFSQCGAGAINDRGQIVGSVPNVRNPALFENGRVTVLPMPPGWSSAVALDINEHSQIVGISKANSGTSFPWGAWLWAKRS